jgi:hypothetical protein
VKLCRHIHRPDRTARKSPARRRLRGQASGRRRRTTEPKAETKLFKTFQVCPAHSILHLSVCFEELLLSIYPSNDALQKSMPLLSSPSTAPFLLLAASRKRLLTMRLPPFSPLERDRTRNHQMLSLPCHGRFTISNLRLGQRVKSILEDNSTSGTLRRMSYVLLSTQNRTERGIFTKLMASLTTCK